MLLGFIGPGNRHIAIELLGNSTGDRISFLTNPDNVGGEADTETMVITNPGNVGIGITNPGYKFTVNGQPAANGYTAFTNYSDSRLKKNVVSIGNTLDRILKLRPVEFSYNEEYLQLYSDTQALSCLHKGFIAQEVKELFPEMVGVNTLYEKEYYDLNLSNLQVYLVKAMQEQQQIIDRIQVENSLLKAENELLKTSLNQTNVRLEKIEMLLNASGSK